ncbi:MAG TPA: hypothetical protein VF235_08435 [Actinomycetota bacterium]
MSGNEEDHVPISATFPCARCDGTSSVVLLAPGVPDLPYIDGRLHDALIGDEGWRLAIDGPMRVTIGPVSEHRAVAAALRRGDAEALAAIDPEYASFCCRRCGTTYCRDHLLGVAVFDGGFYDATYATCPEGHRVMLDD